MARAGQRGSGRSRARTEQGSGQGVAQQNGSGQNGSGRAPRTRNGSSSANGSASGNRRRTTPTRPDEQGLIPILAGIARDVENALQRPPVRPGTRTKFQVAALLVREERARIQQDATLGEAKRAQELKRIDGLATLLAKIAARDTSLLALLADDAKVSDGAHEFMLTVQRAAGMDIPEEPEPAPADATTEAAAAPAPEARPVPISVVQRQLINPFLEPDFEAAVERAGAKPRRLAGWELLEPLFRSFEEAAPGAPTSMPLPPASALAELRRPDDLFSAAGARRPLPPLPAGRELMPHQAQVVASAAQGHRTYLLADEPGLGKTAQALLAAQAANAYPLLVVVPNVVKTNWAHEVRMWTPERRATVVHGDGDDVDAFADVVIVNYEILDRHVGWMGDLGFRGMVVDEAHFIKNKGSQRSQHVLAIADRIRERAGRPLMMALTGTPLINDIEDFRAIWQLLGWIDDEMPLGPLVTALEETGLTPADRGFSMAAREAVVNQGIVRRRKIEVVADIPARRVADLPVELDGAAGRSIRAAEDALGRRLVGRYRAALQFRLGTAGGDVTLGEHPIDLELVRRVAAAELKEASSETGGENVFTMVRRIGQAKAGLAADYAAQLARNVGKVVFFAKHIDVMDQAERTFAERGLRYASIRGEQTRTVRDRNVKAFQTDPEVAIAVCSLTAAGVGLNLQVASNMVLAELSWTAAEQTQAIDRIHRIGQSEPVTAWRVIAAQTIDATIAELIDTKSGLAARALDGAAEEDSEAGGDVQLEALVALLTKALEAERAGV